MPLLYPSLIFQERVLGFALGSAVGMGAMFHEQRVIWSSTAHLADVVSGGLLPSAPPVQMPPPLLGREAREQLAHVWNTAIDKTLGALVVALSSKGTYYVGVAVCRNLGPHVGADDVSRLFWQFSHHHVLGDVSRIVMESPTGSAVKSRIDEIRALVPRSLSL